jgi:Trp operon repressor
MLYRLFSAANSATSLDELLDLTFTESERAKMIERWRIYDACDRGLSQREIAKEVPCSIVTATRGAKNFRENKETIRRFLIAFRAEDSPSMLK